jgi:hypothetical protein
MCILLSDTVSSYFVGHYLWEASEAQTDNAFFPNRICVCQTCQRDTNLLIFRLKSLAMLAGVFVFVFWWC